MQTPNSQIVIYKDKNGNIKIDVRFDGDTVWLTQDTIATLYDKGRSTVTEHIQNVFQEGELDEKVVCREFRRTTAHGAIKGKTQETTVKYYNLDLIIAVGYRVKSSQGTAFRKWATERLSEYVVKGFVIDSERRDSIEKSPTFILYMKIESKNQILTRRKEIEQEPIVSFSTVLHIKTYVLNFKYRD